MHCCRAVGLYDENSISLKLGAFYLSLSRPDKQSVPYRRSIPSHFGTGTEVVRPQQKRSIRAIHNGARYNLAESLHPGCTWSVDSGGRFDG